MAHQKRRPRTVLAQTYGHPGFGPFAGFEPIVGFVPLKSGLTPITLGPNPTARESKVADDIRYLQRVHLHNFTTAELHALGAFAPLENCKDFSLSSQPIHPAFARAKWNQDKLPKHRALYPLGEGRTGYWDAFANDDVWEALKPCLQLATLYLNNAQLWPWWDALLAVNYIDVPANEREASDQGEVMKRFFRRDPTISGTAASRQKTQDFLNELILEIDFGLICSQSNEHSGLSQSPTDGVLYGITRGDPISDRAKCGICFEMLDGLLPGNISRMNVADQKRCIFGVTNTLLHEFCHALYKRIHSRHPDLSISEIYFEDEVMAELGHSMEQSVFGGIPGELRFPNFYPHWPLGGISVDDFNNSFHINNHGNKAPLIKTKPSDFETLRRFPIHACWTTKLHDSTHWNHIVRSLGGRLAWIGPRTIGTEYELEADGVPPDPVRTDPFTEFEGFYPAYPPNRPVATRSQPLLATQSALKTNRARINRIGTAVAANANARSGKISQGLGNPRRNQGGDSETDDTVPLPCPRYNEIRQYLIANRQALALHTMCFEMPEYTLRAYILRHGGLALTAYEWRTFLLQCEARTELFSFTHFGRRHESTTYRGTITLIRPGWPQGSIQPPPPPQGYAQWAPAFPTLSTLILGLLRVAHTRLWPDENFWDYDLDSFRITLDMFFKAAGIPLPPLTVDGMTVIVFHLASQGDCIVWGPDGVVRAIPTSAAQYIKIQAGDKPKRRRRKRLIDWSKNEDSSEDESEPDISSTSGTTGAGGGGQPKWNKNLRNDKKRTKNSPRKPGGTKRSKSS